MRNLIMSAVLVGASLFGSTVFAQEPVEGRNYATLGSPVPVAQPEKKSKWLQYLATAVPIAINWNHPLPLGLQR